MSILQNVGSDAKNVLKTYHHGVRERMSRDLWAAPPGGCPRYLGPSPLTAEQGVLHFSHFRFIFVCRALPEDGRFCGYSAYSRQYGRINFE